MPRAVLPPISHDRLVAVVDRVLGMFVARGALRRDEVDDVRSTVTLRVLQQSGSQSDSTIDEVDNYIARMTINAVNDVLRARRAAPVVLDEATADVSDQAPEPQDVLATRQMLLLLWQEVGKLPVMQRRALLLHARDESGGSAIHLLIFTGMATVDDIASTLEFTRAEVETMWDDLPLPDLSIAALLGATRPHVISLRRAARERLERARRRWLSPRFK